MAMEIPRRLLEECVELMRENRGTRALYLVQSHGIESFGQLQRTCEQAGVRTWRDALSDEEIKQREDARAKKENPWEESAGNREVFEIE